MQAIDRLIKNTESEWLEKLQVKCREIFKEIHLPSHDEKHHTRVWNHAKELLSLLSRNGVTFNEKDVEKLIIAVFFHDTGMSVTMQKEHGAISRRIAKDFLKETRLPQPEVDEILDAVENHDKKDYQNAGSGKLEFKLQTLLNLSDDLDALSFVGSYRYAEIYLLRKTTVKELSDAVLDNLHKRFQHMKELLAFSPNYLKAQTLRYMATRNYFKDLNFQIKQVGDDLSTFNGPIGIINFIKELMIDQKLSVNEACKQVTLIAGDFYVANFFEKLEKESSV